jgi:hypothetical protein
MDNITAYDQIRYLKNKDNYTYTKKTAGELIKLIAIAEGLSTGIIEDTGWIIASRVEAETTFADMISTALDLTLENKKEMFVLFDDYGKMTLKNISSMVLDILIDEESGENYNYSSSIDSDTYNVIRLERKNEKTGKIETYTAKDDDSIKKWGILQYYDTIQEGEDGKAKADALLKLYNSKTRTLSIQNAFGDTRVRASSMIYVKLNLGDIKVNNLMLVEKVKHEFKNDEHFMNLTLRGGEFVA